MVFKKGIIPWNKGKKGTQKPNKTSYKKGNIPISPYKKGNIPWSKTHKMYAWNKGKKGLQHANKTSFRKGERRFPEVGFKKGRLPTIKQLDGIRRMNIERGNPAKRPEVRAKLSAIMKGNKYATGAVRSKETRAKISMARLKQIIPYKDTDIELKIQSQLISAEIAFEKHKAISGQPDIFIAGDNFYKGIAIFADGCATHPCPIHKGRITKLFDDEKRRLHDKNITNNLFQNGYYVMRFWEHDIKDKSFNVVEYLKQVITPLQSENRLDSLAGVLKNAAGGTVEPKRR